MTITCFIRYQIDPLQRDAFRETVDGTLGVAAASKGEWS